MHFVNVNAICCLYFLVDSQNERKKVRKLSILIPSYKKGSYMYKIGTNEKKMKSFYIR